VSEVLGTAIDLWPVTLLIGLALLWFAWKRLSGRLRVFVMMTGGSLVLFLLSVLLYNGISWFSGQVLGKPGIEEPLLFIVAALICPLAFVVGIVGALVTRFRQGSLPR